MFGMCKTKHSSKDCNRCLFIVSKTNIFWSCRRIREFINHYFEQVIEPFLVLNIYFTFFLSVVDCTSYKSTIKSNCILLLCHVCVGSSRQELFCKNSILRNLPKFTGKRLCEILAQVFSCEFREIFKNFLSYRKTPVAASGVSEWIYTL